MKLRTEIRGFADGTHYAAVKAGDNADAINHDAACAHALMLAMEENVPSAFVNSVPRMRARASELLREWGFDSGEDGK